MLGMKSIYRRLMNKCLKPIISGMHGKVLDLASSASPSYRKNFEPGIALISGDVKASQGITHIDFDARLPFDEGSFDHVLCINALYIAKDPVFTIKELRRVTRTGGMVVVVTPFIFPEAPEPHDYSRWTSEGLKSMFVTAGFSEVKTTPFGGHFTSSLFIIEPFLFFRLFKFAAQEISLMLDRLIPEHYRASRPCPLGYAVVATR